MDNRSREINLAVPKGDFFWRNGAKSIGAHYDVSADGVISKEVIFDPLGLHDKDIPAKTVRSGPGVAINWGSP